MYVVRYGHDDLTTLPEIPEDRNLLWIHNNRAPLYLRVPDHIIELRLDDCQEVYLEYLPDTLERLRIDNCKISSLSALPPNLKELFISEYLFLHCSIHYLPKNVVNVIIRYEPNHRKRIKKINETIFTQEPEDRIKAVNCKLNRERSNSCCKAVKEELMARTWATERIMDWCFDEEEKAEWRMHE